MIARDDIDVIDIGCPNHLHKDIALAAAQAGKWIVCEKPLAMNSAEAEAMTKAVEDANVPNMVWYNYRRVPAISLARQLVEEGRIGKPFHLPSDLPPGTGPLPKTFLRAVRVPLATRRRRRRIRGHRGSPGALDRHGDVAQRTNSSRSSPTPRRSSRSASTRRPGTCSRLASTDAVTVLVRFGNGSMGTFESTRYARGRKNYNTFELNGADGSVSFDLEDPQYLDFFEYTQQQSGKKVEDHLTGWRRVHVTNFEHPYMDKWWVPGCTVGYEHTFINALADFLEGAAKGQSTQPDFRNAWQTQKVCDAILESSRTGTWIDTGVEV